VQCSAWFARCVMVNRHLCSSSAWKALAEHNDMLSMSLLLSLLMVLGGWRMSFHKLHMGGVYQIVSILADIRYPTCLVASDIDIVLKQC
jgi:hypothetical protein